MNMIVEPDTKQFRDFVIGILTNQLKFKITEENRHAFENLLTTIEIKIKDSFNYGVKYSEEIKKIKYNVIE